MLLTGVGAFFFALLLHAQLGVSSRLSTPVRALTGVGIVAGLLGLGMLGEMVDPDPTLNVQGELGALLPVPAGMVPASSVSDFLDRTEVLTEELEQMSDSG